MTTEITCEPDFLECPTDSPTTYFDFTTMDADFTTTESDFITKDSDSPTTDPDFTTMDANLTITDSKFTTTDSDHTTTNLDLLDTEMITVGLVIALVCVVIIITLSGVMVYQRMKARKRTTAVVMYTRGRGEDAINIPSSMDNNSLTISNIAAAPFLQKKQVAKQ